MAGNSALRRDQRQQCAAGDRGQGNEVFRDEGDVHRFLTTPGPPGDTGPVGLRGIRDMPGMIGWQGLKGRIGIEGDSGFFIYISYKYVYHILYRYTYVMYERMHT